MNYLVQKQIPTQQYADDNGVGERVHCPFCYQQIDGQWDEHNYLVTDGDYCHHFTGYAQGYGTPTAMFKGVVKE